MYFGEGIKQVYAYRKIIVGCRPRWNIITLWADEKQESLRNSQIMNVFFLFEKFRHVRLCVWDSDRHRWNIDCVLLTTLSWYVEHIGLVCKCLSGHGRPVSQDFILAEACNSAICNNGCSVSVRDSECVRACQWVSERGKETERLKGALWRQNFLPKAQSRLVCSLKASSPGTTSNVDPAIPFPLSSKGLV